MLRMMIAAAAALVPTATSATAPAISVSDDGTVASVSYEDLNLGSPVDRSKLTGRIRRAANLVCFNPSLTDPLVAFAEKTQCYRIAVQSGVSQMEEAAARQGG